jgi:DNA replication initiation complex subunit (GINS family)
MADEEIRITYETIYEMLRNEKQRDDLTKLPKTFFSDAVEYLEEKKKILNAENQDLFSEAELEKTRVQINNIRRMLKDLFDRREKKLIILAMNLSRTENVVYDKSVLLDKEIEYLDHISKLLRNYRENVVKRVSNGFMPNNLNFGITLSPVTQKTGTTNAVGTAQPKLEVMPKDNKSVRFIHAVPKFVGPNGKVFGPYEPEDMASLPEKIVYVLVKKGRAEEVNFD